MSTYRMEHDSRNINNVDARPSLEPAVLAAVGTAFSLLLSIILFGKK